MNYEEAMAYLKKADQGGMSLGLERMRRLCEKLGNPQKELRFIHIAGTNGKGSTAAYISSITGGSGYRTGRYVSPAVFQYEECIQCEDEYGIRYIDASLLAQTVTQVAEAVKEMTEEGWEAPTVFEQETAMAFLAFVHWQCRLVILEVGLGGKEDATNVIDRTVASVITPIGMDHTAVLGSSMEEIAAAKAGIIKENGSVFMLQHNEAAAEVIRKVCKEKHARLMEVDLKEIRVLKAELEGSTFSYQGERYHTGMAGCWQTENAALAIAVCKNLTDFPAVGNRQRIQGIRRAVWHGRFECVSREPLIIVDGAHNPAGAKALRHSIRTLLSEYVLHAVMGVFADKDYPKMLDILVPEFETATVVTAPSKRGLDRKVLAGEWRKRGCHAVSEADSVKKALDKALAQTKAAAPATDGSRQGEEGYNGKRHGTKGHAILVFGSLSLLKELQMSL